MCWLQESDEVKFDSYARIEHVLSGSWLHAVRGQYIKFLLPILFSKYECTVIKSIYNFILWICVALLVFVNYFMVGEQCSI